MSLSDSRKKWLVLFVFLFSLTVVVTLSITWQINLSPASKEEKEVNFVVAEGENASVVARKLEEEGLIRDGDAFSLYLKLWGKDRDLKKGEYLLSPSLSLPEIVSILLAGKTVEGTFTIPEGLTLQEVAYSLEKQGVVSSEEFLKVAQGENEKWDYDFLASAPKGPNRLEGYLFPDTYRYLKGSDARTIIEIMLNRFGEVFTPDMEKRTKEMGFNVNQLITLASIIEKEAKLEEERPLISAVFHNRLKQNMRLESCATVQYIIGEPKPVLTTEDISIPSPYNTYLNVGLPPGPICNPGLSSIKAALYPEEGIDYLYFVAKGDGSHAFSKTYEEHLTQKRKYQGE